MGIMPISTEVEKSHRMTITIDLSMRSSYSLSLDVLFYILFNRSKTHMVDYIFSIKKTSHLLVFSYTFFFSILIAHNIAIIDTPTSPNIASHMFA